MYNIPFTEAPAEGQVIDVAPGVKWLRLPLPFRLDHVNIYLIADGDGWAVLDAGIYNEKTIALWQALSAGALKGMMLTRLIVTHHHPDHIGMAGWFCDHFDVPLLTSQTAYLFCHNLSLNPGMFKHKQYYDFYRSHGMDHETAELVGTHGIQYLNMVSTLPITFLRLMQGDTLDLGGRNFRVLTGDGHAPEMVMLYCHDEKLLFSADQVIVKISPNVSVWAAEPNGDPLGHYMRALRLLRDNIPDDVLVLPGHQLPFKGLHERCNELLEHHEERCDLASNACREGPKSIAELVPVLFHRELDAHQMSFAFSETLAHVNRLVRRGNLAEMADKDGTLRYIIPE